MDLLAEFMRELGSTHFNATIVEIISDNARSPSERLRKCTPRRRPLVRDDEKTCRECRISRYSCGRPPSAHRSLSRYHSEPIQISPLVFLIPTGSSRWAPSTLAANVRDQILVAPQRSCDRWGVTRNHSDSALLSILPKRSECKTVANHVLTSLERKCSASKVLAEMVQASKLYSLNDDRFPNDEEHQVAEECLLEQLIVIPGATKRREIEGKERFIRSILDVPEEEQEPEAHDEDGDELLYTPRCSATRKVLGGMQAMMGFFLLVVQIISVELLGPVLLNANHLVGTLVEALPSSEKSYDLVLPLFGVSSGAAQMVAISREDISGTTKFARH